MGNTSPSSQTTSQIINKHWQPISPILWKNKATSQIIKEKRLVFQSQQQMKYVFNCLVRRMNNYHPNVLKVFYLRKNYQKGSVCNCGEKHTLQVYLQNVQSTLENYITKHSKNQQQQTVSHFNRKCVCMQIVKAALYLKQRYGPFIVSQRNIWIQQPLIQHQFQDRQIQSPSSSSIQKLNQHQQNQQRKQQIQKNIKAKLWISRQQQQNFPDHSCQEKEMCKSIIDLIRNILVKNRLCGCYPNMEVLERYLHLNTVKELEDCMIREHEIMQKGQLMISNVVKVDQKVPFTRTLRSFSAQDSSSQPQPYFVPNIPQPQNRGYQHVQQQQPTQRKYSSIQYVRKPIEKQYHNMTIGRKTQIIENPTTFQYDHLMVRELKQNQSINIKTIPKNKIDSLLNQGHYPSLWQENINDKIKFNKTIEKPSQLHNTVNFQNLRMAQIINSRNQYRHGNNFIGRQIINIADMTGNNKTQVIGNDNKSVVKTEVQKQVKNVTEQNKQIKNQNNKEKSIRHRSSSRYENQRGQMSNIDFNNDIAKIKYIQISQDKGTSPTDRTKFDLSLKQDQKKQQQAINTSRKNISIIPISMQSTSGAGSILKPIIHSHDHLHKIQAQHRDFEHQIMQRNQQQIQDSKQKKQSASSSKSEKNYSKYHQITNSQKIQNQEKRSILKKRMSDSIMPSSKKGSEGNISKQQLNLKQSTKKQKQRSQSGLNNRIEDLVSYGIGNEQIGRLRKSQFIQSQKSHKNSNKSSRRQSKDINQIGIFEQNKIKVINGELQSLALMQFKFKTNVSIDNSKMYLEVHQQGEKNIQMMAKQGVSIRQCASGELREFEANELDNRSRVQQFDTQQPKQRSQRNNEKSTDVLEKLKQTPQSSRRQSLKDQINQSIKSSSVQQSLHSIHYQPQTFSKIDSPQYKAQPKINNIKQQISQLIKRQTQQPSIVSYDNNCFKSQQQQPQEYHININKQQTYFYLDSLQSLEKQKQMSHPLLTQTNMVKKLSLKEEFNQLLNFDDQNDQDYSYSRQKAHTQQNKQKKRLKLDQKQGKQTVSIYNESQYNHSDNVSKRASQKDFKIKLANPPLNNRKKQINTVSRYARQNNIKKLISKHDLDKQMVKKKMQQIMNNNTEFTQPTPQQILRLTSSGHQDNSIKQKVISKKAQFAQLKNQMNNLLL